MNPSGLNFQIPGTSSFPYVKPNSIKKYQFSKSPEERENISY